MNNVCEKKTAHSQNILHGDSLYNIKRKKYKTVCAELAFAKVDFDRMVMIFFIEFVFLSLLSMQLDYYNTSIQRVFDQIKDRNSHSLYAHKLYFNACKLYLKWKKLQNVCYIYNAFKFCGIFSTFSN